MHAASIQNQMAAGLIEAVLGQSLQAQMDLATKMVGVAMSMKLQAPSGTADMSGLGDEVDLVS